MARGPKTKQNLVLKKIQNTQQNIILLQYLLKTYCERPDMFQFESQPDA